MAKENKKHVLLQPAGSVLARGWHKLAAWVENLHTHKSSTLLTVFSTLFIVGVFVFIMGFHAYTQTHQSNLRFSLMPMSSSAHMTNSLNGNDSIPPVTCGFFGPNGTYTCNDRTNVSTRGTSQNDYNEADCSIIGSGGQPVDLRCPANTVSSSAFNDPSYTDQACPAGYYWDYTGSPDGIKHRCVNNSGNLPTGSLDHGNGGGIPQPLGPQPPSAWDQANTNWFRNNGFDASVSCDFNTMLRGGGCVSTSPFGGGGYGGGGSSSWMDDIYGVMSDSRF